MELKSFDEWNKSKVDKANEAWNKGKDELETKFLEAKDKFTNFGIHALANITDKSVQKKFANEFQKKEKELFEFYDELDKYYKK